LLDDASDADVVEAAVVSEHIIAAQVEAFL
jgi:hypothetical protein